MIAKLFKITRSAWIVFFIAFIAAFLMAGLSNAQSKPDEGDPEVRAKIYGVTFPIAELGSCKTYYECRSYCEDPVNAPACLDFGKKKGFYNDEEQLPKKEEILEKAKKELGCDSYETCQSFCQIPANYEKCNSFAKKEGLSGGHVEDPKNKVILEKAKEILGCDSYSTCASYCSDDSNREKCTVFAKETGLRGGEQRVGPGGCTSEDTCRTFCSDPNNFQVCKGFASSGKQEFTGPGGCNSQDSCRSYCERNPKECGPPPGGGGGSVAVPVRYDPQEMCNRTPACSWKDNTCQCGFYDGGKRDEEAGKRADEYAKVCREDPARCTPGGIGGSDSREDRAVFEKYCRENPEKCRPAYSDMMGGRNYDPVQECAKYAGCSWQAGTCQCGTRYENYPPSPGSSPPAFGTPAGGAGSYPNGDSYRGNTMSRDQQEATCRSGGGSCDWSSGVCNCRGYRAPSGDQGGSQYPRPYATAYSGSTAPDPATGCRNAGGNWNGSYCQMPQTSTTNTTNTVNTTQNTAPSGMSRDSQEAGCRGCGGTCSWNGDFCNCQCGGSGSSGGGSAPVPAQTSAPAPQPVQESQPVQQSQPAPQPAQESQTAPQPPATEPAPAPAVQGITAVRNILDRILDLLR